MTLPASGAISLFDVNDELGLSHTAQIGLLCTNVRTLFGTASGAVGLQTGYGKSNTSVPGAPTGVSASATSYSSASVSFSAPACTGHLTIDSYQAISSPGCITATGTSPISVTGLSGSTSYTFRVRAHNSLGYGSYSSASGSITTPAASGSVLYCSPGTYSWTVPSGVTSVSVLAVSAGNNGRGGPCKAYFTACYYNGQGCYYLTNVSIGGTGGALAWRNNISVTPGSTIQVVVGSGSSTYGRSAFNDNQSCANIKVRANRCAWNFGYSCSSVGDTVGLGGYTSGRNLCVSKYNHAFIAASSGVGGGGASGYPSSTYPASAGGHWGHVFGGTAFLCTGCYAEHGFCGGGAAGDFGWRLYGGGGGGGGGVGVYGRGSDGVFRGNLRSGSITQCCYGGQYQSTGNYGTGGSGGSNGAYGRISFCSNFVHAYSYITNPPDCYAGYQITNGGNGGSFGGGGGASPRYTCPSYVQTFVGPATNGTGGSGAVRIVWPGNTRQFPTTCVGSP